MIGKQQIQLGANELMSGVAVSDFSTDAALSNVSSNINPFSTPGVIRVTAAAVDESTNLESNVIIASCEDATSTYAKVAVDGGGDIYGVSAAGVLTDIFAGTATTKYVFGVSDMVAFDAGSTPGFNLVSLTDDVAKFTVGGSLDETWFTSTLSGSNTLIATVPHPMVVFNGLLWIANGSNLVSVTTAGVVVPTALILEKTDVIQALHIDPATGYMMVSATRFSSAHATSSNVYIFDAFSTLPRRTIPVIDDKITGFCSSNGTVYVGCSNRLAVWNGNGVTYLRTLKNAAIGTSTDLLYKHHMTSYGNILFYADGATLMAYGEPVGLQRKGFFPVSSNPLDTSHLGAITLLASGVVGFGWITSSTPKWYAVDITSVSAGAAVIPPSLSFNNIFFPRPVNITWMRVFTTAITTTTGIGSVAISDEKEVSHASGAGASKFVVTTAEGGTKYIFDFPFNFSCQSMQPVFGFDTQGFGVTRVVIYYNVAE